MSTPYPKRLAAWVMRGTRRLLCRHTHGRLVAIEFDGEAVYECTACSKRIGKPLPAGRAPLESEAQIVGDKLAISLRLSTLAHAARHSVYFDRWAEQGMPLKITDEAAFAKSVAHALNREEEDGSTPITRMLDRAFVHVIEQGEEGIECAANPITGNKP